MTHTIILDARKISCLLMYESGVNIICIQYNKFYE